MYLVHGNPLLCQIEWFILCRKEVAIDPSHYFLEILKFSKVHHHISGFQAEIVEFNLAATPIGAGNANVTYRRAGKQTGPSCNIYISTLVLGKFSWLVEPLFAKPETEWFNFSLRTNCLQ